MNRVYLNQLFDYYHSLLTANEQDIFQKYYEEDLTLQEIADEGQISKSAISKTLKTVEKIELLPYHNVGKFKWKKLGLNYPLEGVRQADNNDIKRAKEILGIN